MDSLVRIMNSCSKTGIAKWGFDLDFTIPITFLIISCYFYKPFKNSVSLKNKFIILFLYLVALFVGYWITGIIGMLYIIGSGIDSL